MRSRRADNRGHWPRGHRRNDPGFSAADLRKLRIRAKRLIEHHRTWGRISYRALADHLGVSDRSVRRWLNGEDWPPAPMARQVKRWVQRQHS